MPARDENQTPPARSRIMRAIRQKNTKPEIAVRRLLHAMGLRFRLHQRDLPGKPDIVLARHRAAVFVHGCFWHQHEDCKISNVPRTRTDYWLPKLARTIERDAQAASVLESMGWRVLVIWECELGNLDALRNRLSNFFGKCASDPGTVGSGSPSRAKVLPRAQRLVAD